MSSEGLPINPEGLQAVVAAIKSDCFAFSDGDGSLGYGWADQEYDRVATKVIAAYLSKAGFKVERDAPYRFIGAATHERLVSEWQEIPASQETKQQ